MHLNNCPSWGISLDFIKPLFLQVHQIHSNGLVSQTLIELTLDYFT